jgi:putative oxidoreductase
MSVSDPIRVSDRNHRWKLNHDNALLDTHNGQPDARNRRGRVALVALWLTKLALAGMFMFTGGLKLTGAPALVALFDAIGVGQWFRYVTGSIEVASAVALLVPSLAPFGALLLVPTMVGAIATHLFSVGGSAVPATVLLIGSLAIVWARRDQLASVLSRRR